MESLLNVNNSLNKETFSFSQRIRLLPLFGPSLFQVLRGEDKKVKGARKGGRGGKKEKGRRKKQLKSETPYDLKTPRSLEPMLPAVCEKNVFRFFPSSASGKPHFSLQQHNAKSAEFKAQLFKDHCL